MNKRDHKIKVLHTADIHLRNNNDERWKALLSLIETGRQEKIDVMAISGDLFDLGVHAENLRVEMRDIFSGNGFKIVLIPGNHDHQSYRKGIFFGEDSIILNDLNEPFELEDVSIWGMPFQQLDGEKILEKLRSLSKNIDSGRTNILMYHGELLDTFYSRRDFGDEGEGRYMPVRLSYFKDLQINYVLAGHFHSRFDTRILEDGGYFVYPGSPVSITRRETGQRKVNIFEIGDPPKEHLLDTPHFEKMIIELDPFNKEDPTEIINTHLDQLHQEARIILTVTGYINSGKSGITEEQLVERIKKIPKDRVIETHQDFRDIGRILEDNLFIEFNEKVEDRNYNSEKKKQLRETVIRAMTEGGW